MNSIDLKERKPKKGQKVLVSQDPTKTATKEALYGIYDGEKFLTDKHTVFANYEIGVSTWADITHWMPLPKVHKYFESKKEELEYYMPCFVYYDKPKGSGTVNRIGIAESFLGDKVIIREGNNCRDIYDIDSIEIINLND